MRSTHWLIAISLLLSTFKGVAQDSSLFHPKLILDFPLLEVPHLSKAAGMAYNKRLGNLAGGKLAPNIQDYTNSYESFSMQQALAITKNLHATNYYFNNKVWNKWLPPNTKNKVLLNRLVANLSSGAVDYVLAYYLMIFGPVWLHEEFHRNGITHQCISSHNDTYYRLNGGLSSGSVSKVRDEDLIRWKQTKPQEMIRSFAAGIESQYELVRNMRKDNFFRKTNYANAVMNILITKQAVDYVNQYKHLDYDRQADSTNKFEATISQRDYVGWDFTAWVYDLFKPNEPYANRGPHANGVGLKRTIYKDDLSNEEMKYLNKMGKLQYLNFISPAMIGVSRIKVGKQSSFSFAMRHLLNSFGYDLGADIFIDKKGSQWFIGLHGYHNKNRFFPGIEIEKPAVKISLGKIKAEIQARGMLWLQPRDQSFTTSSSDSGGLLQIRSKFALSKTMSVYSEMEAKTAGWVAGNPYLNKNLSLRMGICFDLN